MTILSIYLPVISCYKAAARMVWPQDVDHMEDHPHCLKQAHSLFFAEQHSSHM
jgi:hypothetical protein